MEYTMKQLSLFSLDELAECYLATKVVQKVRASLRKPSRASITDFENFLNEDYEEQFGKVIKFPVKKVS